MEQYVKQNIVKHIVSRMLDIILIMAILFLMMLFISMTTNQYIALVILVALFLVGWLISKGITKLMDKWVVSELALKDMPTFNTADLILHVFVSAGLFFLLRTSFKEYILVIAIVIALGMREFSKYRNLKKRKEEEMNKLVKEGATNGIQP